MLWLWNFRIITRKESDIIKLEEKISKEEQLISKKLANLSKKDFDSELSANLSLKQVSAQLKYHRLSQDKIIEKSSRNSKVVYQITADIQPDNKQIIALKRKAVRFIIATNKLEVDSFTADDILKKYKEQQAPERGESIS